jgi:lipoic acid synthetase
MKPSWLKIKLPSDKDYPLVKEILARERLHTVCIEAKCPNRIECWQNRSMTFMILGSICTRNCKFCAVESGNPNGNIDATEPERISQVIKQLNLSYIVITSVTRDDLEDGGARVFAETIKKINDNNPKIKVEVLVPDFQGNMSAIKTVTQAGCDVFSHNVETVKRLTPLVRDERASYRLSLEVLKTAHSIKPELDTKSGFMLGLGETEQDVKDTIQDLFDVGVSIFTIGQYLQPAKHCLPTQKYIQPQQFSYYKDFALDLGFKKVVAGPLVRSSYRMNE